MTPRGMPSKGRAHPLERWGFFVLCIGWVALVIALFGPEKVRRRLGDEAIGGAVIVSVIGVGAGALMILTGRGRGARDVMARAGRVCPGCRYPLPPTQTMGVCPECGDPYTLDDNVIAWRARYPWLQL